MAAQGEEITADWRKVRDGVCNFTVTPVRDTVARLKKYLNADEALELECKVIKHPDACPACAANERCEDIPLHHWCRCRRGVAFTAKRIQSLD